MMSERTVEQEEEGEEERRGEENNRVGEKRGDVGEVRGSVPRPPIPTEQVLSDLYLSKPVN
jgi:hypothetical protein